MKENWRIVILLGLICLFFGFFRINERYTFEWDQEDDAVKVMNMIEQRKPILIGPRVANANGFFVGPYHYYFLWPFYTATKGDPIAGAIAVIVVSIITSITGYLVTEKLYGKKAGLTAGIIWATTTNIVSWNVMYTTFFGIMGYFLCLKVMDSKPKFFPWLMLIYGLATTSHLVPISMGLSVVVAWFLADKKPKIRQLFFGIGLFILPFLPIIIFDLRHDFLNFKKIGEFLFFNKNNGEINPWWLFLRSFWRGLNLNIFSWDIYSQKILIFFCNLLVLAIVALEVWQLKIKQKILTVVWILTPLIILGFYRGNIPEYYYGLALSILPIFLGKIISKLKMTTIILVLLVLIGVRFLKIAKNTPFVSLSDKRKMVEYMVNQKNDEFFNISYDLGSGMDTGYNYLFRFYRKEPENSEKGHLYTVVLTKDVDESEILVRSNNIGVVRR